jgi:hypothetical protein
MRSIRDEALRMLIENSVTTNFLFAHQTDLLADESKAATSRLNGMDLIKGIHVNKHFPWLIDFMETLPIFIAKPLTPPGLVDLHALFDVSLHFSHLATTYN